MPTHDIIVVGASAGGVEALMALVNGLPADLPAAVFVVLHIPAEAPSVLAKILDRAGPLPARSARDGATIQSGHIYIAPPDRHLLLTGQTMRVVRGPHENRHRPAIDPLFRTAALAFGPRVVGVILSGALNDGTAGLIAIKRRGGIAIAQDPTTALFPSMPQSACTYVALDWCLPIPDIATRLAQLATTEVQMEEGAFPVADDMQLEANLAGLDPTATNAIQRPGTLSAYTCPDCNGPLWEIQDGELLRFRCRVGHAFTAGSMMAGQADVIEEALWVALNTLEESAQMYRRMADDAQRRNLGMLAQRFTRQMRETQRRTAIIRQALRLDKDTPDNTPSATVEVDTSAGDAYRAWEAKPRSSPA
jgi:two-component system chemotaxis response regulator CheB